jgi:membrane protease YdiL (CAAX protease family)
MSRSPDVTKYRGRPGLVLAVWVLLLALGASLAPLVQSWLGVPFQLLSLVMLAPALAALVVVVRPDWAPAWWPRVAAMRVMVSSAIALVAILGFVVALVLLSGRSLSWPSADVGAPSAVFVAVQAFGVLCEELGWRGVVQRVGEQFARPVVVSAIAGFLFGVTHLGNWSLGIIPVLTFSITATLMSLTITTIFTGSLWQRMLPAVVVHLGVNLGIMALADPGEPLATTPWALGAAIVMLGIAIVGRAAAHKMRTRTRV